MTATREEAFTALDAADSTNELADILDVIRAEAAKGLVFSSNDVRQALAHCNPQRIGRAFAEASRLQIIEPVGFVKSTSRATHKHRVLTWRAAA